MIFLNIVVDGKTRMIPGNRSTLIRISILYPVYVAENARLRKKRRELMDDASNHNKDIRIENGILKMDGVPFDHNKFFI